MPPREPEQRRLTAGTGTLQDPDQHLRELVVDGIEENVLLARVVKEVLKEKVTQSLKSLKMK